MPIMLREKNVNFSDYPAGGSDPRLRNPQVPQSAGEFIVKVYRTGTGRLATHLYFSLKLQTKAAKSVPVQKSKATSKR